MGLAVVSPALPEPRGLQVACCFSAPAPSFTASHSAALEDFGGLIRRMPHTAVLCLIGVLGLAALTAAQWLSLRVVDLPAPRRRRAAHGARARHRAAACAGGRRALGGPGCGRGGPTLRDDVPGASAIGGGVRDAHEAAPAYALGDADSRGRCDRPRYRADGGVTGAHARGRRVSAFPRGRSAQALSLSLPLVGSRLAPAILASALADHGAPRDGCDANAPPRRHRARRRRVELRPRRTIGALRVHGGVVRRAAASASSRGSIARRTRSRSRRIPCRTTSSSRSHIARKSRPGWSMRSTRRCSGSRSWIARPDRPHSGGSIHFYLACLPGALLAAPAPVQLDRPMIDAADRWNRRRCCWCSLRRRWSGTSAG